MRFRRKLPGKTILFFLNVFIIKFTQECIFMIVLSYFNENERINKITKSDQTDWTQWTIDTTFKEAMRLYGILSILLFIFLTPKLMSSKSNYYYLQIIQIQIK
jgi:hypothetical protein